MSSTKRTRQAMERVDTYRQTGGASVDDGVESSPRDLSEWTDIVGQRIEQAMREGAFDNLAGQGKPLNLNRDPFVPDDQQMTFKLLENNDLKPAWISERSEVLATIERLRQTIDASARWHQRQAQRTADPSAYERLMDGWAAQLGQWTDEINELNQRIDALNLLQPLVQLEVFKLRLDDELDAVGVGRRLR